MLLLLLHFTSHHRLLNIYSVTYEMHTCVIFSVCVSFFLIRMYVIFCEAFAAVLWSFYAWHYLVRAACLLTSPTLLPLTTYTTLIPHTNNVPHIRCLLSHTSHPLLSYPPTHTPYVFFYTCTHPHISFLTHLIFSPLLPHLHFTSSVLFSPSPPTLHIFSSLLSFPTYTSHLLSSFLLHPTISL